MKTPPLNLLRFPYVSIPGEDGVKLRPREWAIVDYLAARRGEVVTPVEIYQHVYRLHPAAYPANQSGLFTQFARIRDNAPFILIARLREIGWVLV